MIPDLAVIVAAYALVRLLNEYVLTDDRYSGLRLGLALVAIIFIAVSLFDVLSQSGSLLPNL
jgi:hypothetical protein